MTDIILPRVSAQGDILLDTWRRLISITNCILLSALSGLYINNKSMHGVNNVKYGNKCFEFSKYLGIFKQVLYS
jgi:hypothetical protein